MTAPDSASPILEYGETSPPSRTMRFFSSPWLLLPLILLLAAGLRWYQLGHESLWLDEFLAVQNSSGRGQYHELLETNVIIEPAPHLTRLSDGPGFWAIWTTLGSDSHPPLYFMLLNLWRQLFGESDLAARALSVLFSLVSMVILFDIARLLHGRVVALWACLLMAVAGAQIQYAQEVRNYTMLLALVLGACDAIVRIERRGANPRRAIALGACLLAALLTHYLAACGMAALGVYALLRLRGRELKFALVSFAGVGVIFAIAWGPFFLEQSRGLGAELAAPREESEGIVWRELRRLAILPVRYFTEPMKESIKVAYIGAVIYLLPLLLLRRRPDLLLWCLLGGLTILTVLATDLARSAHGLAYVRYTFLASAAVYALAAAMLWHMQGFLRHVVPMVLTIACLAALEEPYSITKADSRELATYLAPRCGPEDLLIVHTLPDEGAPARDWQARAMYLALSHYGAAQSPVVFLDGPPSPAIAQRISQARQVWMMSPTLEVPNEQLLPGSTTVESKLFPYVGTVERVELDRTWFEELQF